MSQWAGWRFKIRIAGVVWRVKTYDIDASVGEQDTSHSESEYGRVLGSLKRCRLTIGQATYDETENVFGPPFNLNLRDFVPIEIYPADITRNDILFQCEECMLAKGKFSGDVDGLQPTNTEWVCNDAFILPGHGQTI